MERRDQFHSSELAQVRTDKVDESVDIAATHMPNMGHLGREHALLGTLVQRDQEKQSACDSQSVLGK